MPNALYQVSVLMIFPLVTHEPARFAAITIHVGLQKWPGILRVILQLERLASPQGSHIHRGIDIEEVIAKLLEFLIVIHEAVSCRGFMVGNHQGNGGRDQTGKSQ